LTPSRSDEGGFLVKQKSKLTSLPLLRYVCADWRGLCSMPRRRPLFAMQGESMDAEPARLIIEALKEEKIELFVTLPEEPTASLTQAVQADGAARSEFERAAP
jgi:hypothetical protein